MDRRAARAGVTGTMAASSAGSHLCSCRWSGTLIQRGGGKGLVLVSSVCFAWRCSAHNAPEQQQPASPPVVVQWLWELEMDQYW
jgi:hypothetical protein